MTSPSPLNLSQIVWASGTITQFVVSGRQGAQELLQTVPGTAIAFTHEATLGHDTATRQVALLLSLSTSLTRPVAKVADISGQFELRFIFTVDNLADVLVSTADQPDPQLPPPNSCGG